MIIKYNFKKLYIVTYIGNNTYWQVDQMIVVGPFQLNYSYSILFYSTK